MHPGSAKEILALNTNKIQLVMQLCAHCGMCAESCFMYVSHKRDPKYTPAYKMINAFKVLNSTKKRASWEELHTAQDMLWHRCVLCMRCYCPLGIDIPDMIALGRRICRQKGIFRDYSEESHP
ncbi:MAG: 4Fe-4S dicluster domain-containing protein [Thermodesulfobacteriota bacterium]